MNLLCGVTELRIVNSMFAVIYVLSITSLSEKSRSTKNFMHKNPRMLFERKGDEMNKTKASYIFEESISSDSKSEVLARVPPQDLKALFYLFAGKPDSQYKVYRKPVLISPGDIDELNSKITRKLENHDVKMGVTSVDIGFQKNKTISFGTWKEFSQFDWKCPDVTEYIIVRWDFFVKLPSYEIPQRHTLSVKFTSQINPLEFLRIVFSNEMEEVEGIDHKVSPCVCRIDFVNHILGQELLDRVNEWYEARRSPSCISSKVLKINRFSRSINLIFQYSIPLVGVLLALFLLEKTIVEEAGLWQSLTLFHAKQLFIWLSLTFFGINIFYALGKSFSNWTIDKLYNFGKVRIFEMTNGDKKIQKEIEEANKTNKKKFIAGCVISLILNVLAGLITFVLLQ